MKVIIKLDNNAWSSQHLILPATPEILAALSGVRLTTEQDGRYLQAEDAKPLSFMLVDDALCADLTDDEKRRIAEKREADSRWYQQYQATSNAEKKVKELEERLAYMTKEAA